MGFTNDNNLIKNQECTITYSGNLYQNNSEQITIVYGFGDNWDFTSEKLMTKKQNGFEVKIKMLDYNTFNFCFRNLIMNGIIIIMQTIPYQLKLLQKLNLKLQKKLTKMIF